MHFPLELTVMLISGRQQAVSSGFCDSSRKAMIPVEPEGRTSPALLLSINLQIIALYHLLPTFKICLVERSELLCIHAHRLSPQRDHSFEKFICLDNTLGCIGYAL